MSIRRLASSHLCLTVLMSLCLPLKGMAQDTFAQQSRPVSPSVMASFLTSGESVELIILWRDSPGWYLGPKERSSTSSSPNLHRSSLTVGGVPLNFAYNSAARTVFVQDLEVSLASGNNVVLVDDVRNSTGRIAGVARVQGRFDISTPVAPLLGQAPEIVEFLRCGAGMDSPLGNQLVMQVACNDLVGR